MDRRALRDELQAFGDGKVPFDGAIWLAGEGIVAMHAIARWIQSDDPLDPEALRQKLEEARSMLAAAKKLLGSVPGASRELHACIDRWLALADRLSGKP